MTGASHSSHCLASRISTYERGASCTRWAKRRSRPHPCRSRRAVISPTDAGSGAELVESMGGSTAWPRASLSSSARVHTITAVAEHAQVNISALVTGPPAASSTATPCRWTSFRRRPASPSGAGAHPPAVSGCEKSSHAAQESFAACGGAALAEPLSRVPARATGGGARALGPRGGWRAGQS